MEDKYKTESKFDNELNKVVLTIPTIIGIPRSDYEAVQKITGNRFSEFYNPRNSGADSSFGKGRIGISANRIKNLTFSGLGLKTLNESIKDLTALRHLDLKYNNLTEFPEWLCYMDSLELLELDKNQISYLPEAIGDFKNLISLDLKGNRLTSIPDSVGNIKTLEDIHLQNNQLTSLPETIGNLENLRDLDVQNNQLESIPQTIENCKRIQLDVSGNPLKRGTKIFLGKLKKQDYFIIGYLKPKKKR